MTYTKETTYERIANRILNSAPRRHIPFVSLYNGKLLKGTQSTHRTKTARTWRLFWRLKRFKGLSLNKVCNDNPNTDKA